MFALGYFYLTKSFLLMTFVFGLGDLAMFEKILVATDGSKHSRKAAKFGVDLAVLTGGKVTAVYVLDRGKMVAPVGEISFNIADEVIGGIRDAFQKEGMAAIQQVEDLAKQANVPFDGRVIEGNPTDDILKVAAEGPMDVIIIGSIGKTGLEKFLLGSVAEKVVRNSSVPVIVVHGD
jgi:nucleotide-binding universal stress UspA family protein